jgi:hypothetical protein
MAKHRDAYTAGFKEGLRSVLRGGRSGSAPAHVRKSVGSPLTDGRTRQQDVERVRGDVKRAERIVIQR